MDREYEQIDRNYEQITKVKDLVRAFERSDSMYSEAIRGLESGLYSFNEETTNIDSRIEIQKEEQIKLREIINSIDIYNIDNYSKIEALNYLLLNELTNSHDYNITNTLKKESDKIWKLRYKDERKFDNKIAKMDKKLYKKLKKNKRLMLVSHFNKKPFRAMGLPISEKFSELSLDMDKLLDRFNSAARNYYESHTSKVGIDKSKLSGLHRVFNEEIKEENICLGTMDTYRLYKKIKEFNSYEYHIKESSKLRKLETKYEDVLKRAREIWFLEQLDKMFEKTIIGNSEICKEIIKISNSLSTKLKKDIKKLDKEYEKLDMDRVIKDADTYRKMARELDDLDKQIAGKIKSGDILEAEKLKKEYEELLNKITTMSKENPGLYKPIFDPERIIIDDIKKRIEIEEKRKINNNKINAKTVIKNDSNNLSEKSSEPRKTNNNYNDLNEKSNEPKKANKNNYNDFELDINLQTIRSSYYQKYLTEKIQKGNLINIPFSKYLEKIAVDQVELIEIEKKREKMAHNIYQQYLKYYAALENKKAANSFEDFAYYKYNIDDIDVPIENEEEYKGMKL